MSSSSWYYPKSLAANKIPLFDENNFAMWKTKDLVVLETMKYDMLNIVNNGSYVPMYQLVIDNAPVGGLMSKPKTSYDEDEKRLMSLYEKESAAIRNSLPYHIYHLVQNCQFAHALMEILTVAYEGTIEV